LADALRDEFGVEAELIKGSGGVFDVKVDGQLLFSKHEQDRFPDNDEVIGLIKGASG
jgi:selT/selW/selH-like putative selenoprotein